MDERLAELRTDWENAYRQRTRRSAELGRSEDAMRVAASQRSFLATSLPYSTYVTKGEGAYITDVDGNRYIDLAAGWNSCYLGFGNSRIADAVISAQRMFSSPTGETYTSGLRGDLAARLCELVPGVERVLFAMSGSEANAYALRLARAHTKRDKFLKFRLSYHGMYDDLMIGSFSSVGLPQNSSENVVLARYNDKDEVVGLLAAHAHELCAVIVEPISIVGNVEQRAGFLQFLRDETIRLDIPMILDEVITGFRFSMRCAVGYYGITPAPDLITFGKMLGGGLPVAAVGGRHEILDANIVATNTHVQSAICHAAALAFLDQLSDELYERTNALGERLRLKLRRAVADHGLRLQITGDSTNVGIHLVPTPVLAPEDSAGAHRDLFHLMRLGMTVRGCNWSTAGIGITAAFTEADVDAVAGALGEVLAELRPVLPAVAPELVGESTASLVSA